MARRIISRAQAKAKGQPLYFSGNRCPSGHLTWRYVTDYACRDCRLAYHKRWYRKNFAKVSAEKRTPEMLAMARVRKNRWYRANRSRILAKLRTPSMRTLAAARARLWNRLHPAAKRAYRSARRTTKGRHTPQQSLAILVRQRHRCANPFCSTDLRKKKPHLDHKTPLSRGGSNGPRNLQWLCAYCNISKHAKTMREWLQRLRTHRQ